MSFKHHPYSTFKAAWHIDKIVELRESKPIIPVELQLILSDHCNQDCFWCAYRSSEGLSVQNFGGLDKKGNKTHNPYRMIEYGKAKEIIKDAAECRVKSIIFTGGGEPTVHLNHLELFDLALDLDLDVSLNTNGAVLRDGWKEIFPQMTYIRFSVDAGDSDRYSRDRGVSKGTYERVLENLSKISEAIKDQNSKCILGAGYVVTPDNYVDVVEGVRRLKEFGAKYARMASMQSTSGIDIYPENTWELSNKAVEKAKDLYEDENFSVISLTEEAMGNHPEYDFCGFQSFVTYVGADLKVYRCCYTAYTDLGEIASLENQRLKDWWHSEKYKKEMFEFSARECKTCPLDHKNQTILYMIDPDPLHVNFV